MTYLQLMIKCLTFFKNQKEKFDAYGFYYHWLGNDKDDNDLYYKDRAKKALMYLFLLETKNSSNVNNPLLNILEKELSYYDVSICKTFEKAEENTIKSIQEDPYMLDQLCLLEQDELTDEEITEIVKELYAEFKKQMPNNWEIEQYGSGINGVMQMVSHIIPELFFTEKGYKYIDKEYHLDDIELRERCYEYLQDSILYYNMNRVWKVDKSIYNKLYNSENQLDELDESEDFEDDFYEDDDFDNIREEDIQLEGDEIRGECNIHGMDIDNFDILYYSVTLLNVVLRFIKNKQFDKLDRLIELDEITTNYYQGHEGFHDKTLVETFYQPKTMGRDYHRKISMPAKSDLYLDFFLSNNQFTQQYSTQQLSLIIAHCFDYFDSNPINKLIRNNDTINNVLFSINDLSYHKDKIKRLIKIKTEDNK